MMGKGRAIALLFERFIFRCGLTCFFTTPFLLRKYLFCNGGLSARLWNPRICIVSSAHSHSTRDRSWIVRELAVDSTPTPLKSQRRPQQRRLQRSRFSTRPVHTSLDLEVVVRKPFPSVNSPPGGITKQKKRRKMG